MQYQNLQLENWEQPTDDSTTITNDGKTGLHTHWVCGVYKTFVHFICDELGIKLLFKQHSVKLY